MSISEESNEFYDGSDLLRPISKFTGLSIDKANFLVCQLFALLMGFPFRKMLGPHRVSPKMRHLVEVLIGVPLTLFCFGRQVVHIIAQSAICLLMMKSLKPGIMEKAVFVFAMGYLCVGHIYRMIYDYGGYTLDITGPLMISTQRLSSLAYNIRDGKQAESKLSVTMKKLAVRVFPSLLEFTSYIFSFHGLMCGPFCFYKDYLAFIDGTNYWPVALPAHTTADSKTMLEDLPLPEAASCRTERPPPPDPGVSLLWKCLTTVTCGMISVLVVPYFMCEAMLETTFRMSGFFYKMFYIVACTSLHRQKYYFAWKLGEVVNANAGLGFNGIDEAGKAKWDLLENADIYKVETASSLKVLVDNWNKQTTYWLRYVVYERFNSTLAVFAFSAFWHGFYIGYYLTFIGGGFFIHIARLARRIVRPYFQTSKPLALFYDLLTFIAARLSLSYLVFPFVLLEFWPSIDIYRQVYFCMHIAAAIFAVMLAFAPKPKQETTKES